MSHEYRMEQLRAAIAAARKNFKKDANFFVVGLTYGCLKKGIRKVHICPNNKENISAIYTILNTGGYLLEEFIDDERIIERYEIILVSYSITMHILTKGR